MQTGDTAVRDRVLRLVGRILVENAAPGNVTPETRLADAGLTSMDMVNLMLGVEAEFDLTLPQSDITPENFQSVSSVETLVRKHLQKRAA